MLRPTVCSLMNESQFFVNLTTKYYIKLETKKWEKNLGVCKFDNDEGKGSEEQEMTRYLAFV